MKAAQLDLHGNEFIIWVKKPIMVLLKCDQIKQENLKSSNQNFTINQGFCFNCVRTHSSFNLYHSHYKSFSISSIALQYLFDKHLLSVTSGGTLQLLHTQNPKTFKFYVKISNYYQHLIFITTKKYIQNMERTDEIIFTAYSHNHQ